MTTPVIPPDEEVLDEGPETEPDAPLRQRLLGGSEISIALILLGLILGSRRVGSTTVPTMLAATRS